MATSKALRTPQPKVLNNYVASIKHLNSLAPESVPDTSFFGSNFISPGAGTSPSYTTNVSIGFKLTVNNITYDKFSVSEQGWIILQEPGVSSPIADVMTDVSDNETIFDTFFGNHILLAPWFDEAAIPVRTIDSLAVSTEYNSTITTSILNEIKEGKNIKNWPYHLNDRGVRYKNFYDSQYGKYLLVRWTSSQVNFSNKLKFEVAIFENGRIEFRYWPLESFEPGDVVGTSSAATVGIFWNGTGVSNKFRDFAPLLSYRTKNSSLGGAEYDASYTESSKPYSNSLTTNNWPKNGAVISFSPPAKLIKFLPRKLIGEMSSTREIVRTPGMYDDRKSIAYVSSSIHLPSTLPTKLVGDTGAVDVSLQQHLFVSGSDVGGFFVPNGHVSKAGINYLVAQLDAVEKINKRSDMSFNEHEKDYESTATLDEYYTTGSSLQLFGEGFTAPLKSKTQLYFSLPVSKQTIMPATTSSFYYYDKNLQRWINPAPAMCRNAAIKVVHSNQYNGDYVDYYTHIVTETAVGFDAVGRKISSGTVALSDVTYLTRQSDYVFGSFLNASKGDIINLPERVEFATTPSDAVEKVYGNNFTDNIAFYPSGSQTFNASVEYPFLIEKVVASVPLYITGDWFRDLTTCNKAYGDVGLAAGFTSGAIDFGGPGITFSLLCAKKANNARYIDIICSGTITHTADNTGSVVLYKDSSMKHYMLRPVGFQAFSNPTTVISGSENIFEGNVKLRMTPSIAGGITVARNDRSLLSGPNFIPRYNRPKCVELLTSPKLASLGENRFNGYDLNGTGESNYANRSTRVYLQQVSPLSRGKSGIEFNGNSVLGGNIAYFNVEKFINNPLYYSSSSSLAAEFRSKIDNTLNFEFEAVSLYSLVDSRPSPYLVMPGDTLTVSMSKTRPVTYKMFYKESYPGDTPGGGFDDYVSYQLTGSHGTVMLNTGSIELTIYGSYVREGVGYNP